MSEYFYSFNKWIATTWKELQINLSDIALTILYE